MNETRARSGRQARQIERAQKGGGLGRPYILRNIPTYDVLSEENLIRVEQAADRILAETGFTAEETCFMGDECFDIPALRAAGLAVTVPEAMVEVHGVVHAVTRKSGGHGAVREMIDRIRKAQGIEFPT